MNECIASNSSSDVHNDNDDDEINANMLVTSVEDKQKVALVSLVVICPFVFMGKLYINCRKRSSMMKIMIVVVVIIHEDDDDA